MPRSLINLHHQLERARTELALVSEECYEGSYYRGGRLVIRRALQRRYNQVARRVMQLQRALRSKERQSKRPKVVVTVRGGVAEVAQQPEGIDVEIIDYDNLNDERSGGPVDPGTLLPEAIEVKQEGSGEQYVWVIEMPASRLDYPEVWGDRDKARERFLELFADEGAPGSLLDHWDYNDDDYMSFDDAADELWCIKRVPLEP